MKLKIAVCALIMGASFQSVGQEITFDQSAAVAQAFRDAIQDDGLLPMDELGMDGGYILYQSTLEMSSESATLQLEHVRDYAAVYVDGQLQGTLTNEQKELVLTGLAGLHQLQIYVENIGRITYGPEILENAKGLFGEIRLAGEILKGWTMIPLEVRDQKVEDLVFDEDAAQMAPRFFKGSFFLQTVQDSYLDISGWGMGEVWINNTYLGAYSEQEKQQSLRIAATDLREGENQIVVFELKDHPKRGMKLSREAVFK